MVEYQRKSTNANGPYALFTSLDVLVVQQPKGHEIHTRNIHHCLNGSVKNYQPNLTTKAFRLG